MLAHIDSEWDFHMCKIRAFQFRSLIFHHFPYLVGWLSITWSGNRKEKAFGSGVLNVTNAWRILINGFSFGFERQATNIVLSITFIIWNNQMDRAYDLMRINTHILAVAFAWFIYKFGLIGANIFPYEDFSVYKNVFSKHKYFVAIDIFPFFLFSFLFFSLIHYNIGLNECFRKFVIISIPLFWISSMEKMRVLYASK